LLFGQLIPLGGFKMEGIAGFKGNMTFKSMKTQDLAEERQNQIK